MKVLDLFSGLGGWSQPFKDRGHKVVTVDNDSKFKPDYCVDVLTLTKKDVMAMGYFDVILASPPCTEFSKDNMPDSWNKNRTVNPNTLLLQKTLKIIWWIKPKYWIIENVSGSRPYFYPFLGSPMKKVGSRYLWGNFPICDVKDVYGKWKISPGPDRPALRSLIPKELSFAICKAIENHLVKG
jgi:hypothetical protein